MNKFKKLEKLYKEKSKYEELVSDNLKTLKVRFKDRKHKCIRDGKEVMVEEKALWEEIYQLGAIATEATDILKKQYPDLFKLVDKDKEIAQQISFFTLKHFGFDIKSMTLNDYITITTELINNKVYNPDFIARLIGVQVLLVILGFLIRGIF